MLYLWNLVCYLFIYFVFSKFLLKGWKIGAWKQNWRKFKAQT